MSNCNSLSCKPTGNWVSCQNTCGRSCGCGCTPPCNPCAPFGAVSDDCGCGCGQCNACNNWNHCSNWDWCGTGCGSVCSVCGHNPCTCGCGCHHGNIGCNTGHSGCLVPRYRSVGRTFQRRITQTLCVDDLPECAESPLTLVCVTVCGQATWEPISECRQQLLRVSVPVCVQIRDCAGRCRTGHSTVTLTIPLCNCCPAQDFWKGQLQVAPCIRLAAPVAENEDGCFDATLEVQAEVFLVRITAASC